MSAIHDAIVPGLVRAGTCHLLPGLANSHSGESESKPQGSSSEGTGTSGTSGTAAKVDATVAYPPDLPRPSLLRTTTSLVTDPAGIASPLLRVSLPVGTIALS